MPDGQPSAENATIGAKTAKILLDIEAINFRPEDPYKLTSGWASPVYIDCRKLISFPKQRKRVIKMAVALLEQAVGADAFDAVAGGETAGIPYAAWIADALDLPMLYVRKKPKGFGRNARIEGFLEPGIRVLLVEDLATDGASKIDFVEALRTAGAEVSHAFVVFFYGAFPGALETLRQASIEMHYLCEWRDVLNAVEKDGQFSAESTAQVSAFLDDPVSWSEENGGKGHTP
jgi:orotate phosphoribosyltransferase